MTAFGRLPRQWATIDRPYALRSFRRVEACPRKSRPRLARKDFVDRFSHPARDRLHRAFHARWCRTKAPSRARGDALAALLELPPSCLAFCSPCSCNARNHKSERQSLTSCSDVLSVNTASSSSRLPPPNFTSDAFPPGTGDNAKLRLSTSASTRMMHTHFAEIGK